MTTYVNRAKVAVAGAPGTGTITLGAAVAGHQTFAEAGVSNGATDVAYVIEDVNYAWEIGLGTYSSTGPTLTRDTVIQSSAGGTNKINASANAVVYNSLLAQDASMSSGSTIGGQPVVISSANDGDVLSYNGANWYNRAQETLADGGNF